MNTENILVFRVSSSGDFKNLEINSDIKHFIADIKGVDLEVINRIREKFITFDQSVSKLSGSFVIVSDISFDDNLNIVPTLQEAYDYIEMEEIERQLEL
tara:strand:- start:113 stop:409 length:297 start_codon:yes stop_codon:yes gene_type:complete